MNAPRKKKQRRYGTPSYGPKVLVQNMRAYAAAERQLKFVRYGEPGHIGKLEDMRTKHGEVLGAISALYSTGCITEVQYKRAFDRLTRINHAKVTRRPFGELRRAAR